MSAEDDDSSASSTISRDAVEPPRLGFEQPCLYVALRADQPLAPASRHGLADIDEVQLRRGATRACARVRDGDRRQLIITLPDTWMSSDHARLRRDAVFWVEDGGSKNGTFLSGRQITRARVGDGDVIEVGRTFLLLRESAWTPAGAPFDTSAADLHAPTDTLATLSGWLAHTFDLLRDVAASSIPVHIGGETGTGKEVVARALHHLSGRPGAFVAVNCGALPATLVEAELFGFRKGAFSGAVEDRAGLVRTAHDGTLLLDEIGDLPFAAQSALLRVLQEREVLPVGATKPVKVNARIVSATHRDLEAASGKGSFRVDLLSRLAGFRVRLPPLRERREDLGLLLALLLRRIDDFHPEDVKFSAEAARALMTHTWPRNIRELEHRVRLAVVLAKGGTVQTEHLFGPDTDSSLLGDFGDSRTGEPDGTRAGLSREDAARRALLVSLLERHGGNVSAVARAMGKARMQVQRWMKRYGLDR